MVENIVDGDAVRARVEAAIADHEQVFGNFFLIHLLGGTLSYLPEGAEGEATEACRLTFPVAPFLFNPQGSLHGGIIATAMDISMGHLLAKATGLRGTATIEMKTQYMRAIRDGHATCEGRFLRRGRSICFMESRLTDDEDRLCGYATSTWKLPG